jgi:hypothetical protein
MLDGDLGFLVGKNPFALDLMAARLLSERLPSCRREALGPLLATAETTARYVHETYDVVTETPLETMAL